MAVEIKLRCSLKQRTISDLVEREEGVEVSRKPVLHLKLDHEEDAHAAFDDVEHLMGQRVIVRLTPEQPDLQEVE